MNYESGDKRVDQELPTHDEIELDQRMHMGKSDLDEGAGGPDAGAPQQSAENEGGPDEPAANGLSDRLTALRAIPVGEMYGTEDNGEEEPDPGDRSLADLIRKNDRFEPDGDDALSSIRERIATLGADLAEGAVDDQPTNTAPGEEFGQHPTEPTARIDDPADEMPQPSATGIEDQTIPPAGVDEAPGYNVESPTLEFDTDMSVAAESDEDFQLLAQRLRDIRSVASTIAHANPEQADQLDDAGELDEMSAVAVGIDEDTGIHGEPDQISGQGDNDETWRHPDNAVSQIEAGIADIARQFEDGQPGADASALIAELEARIAETDARVEQISNGSGGDASMVALEQQISQLVSRLEISEQRFGDIQAIEENICRLFENIEQNRQFTSEVAEDTAARISHELGQSGASEGTSATTLEALERGLQSVRENAENADARTQKTLQAVHDTLETVIVRLAAIEGADSSMMPVEQAMAMSDQMLPVFSEDDADDFVAASGAEDNAGSTDLDMMQLPPLEPSALPDDQADTDIIDLGEPVDEQATAAAPDDDDIHDDKESRSDPIDDGARPAVEPVARNEDFIAAARRAARAHIAPPAEGPLKKLGSLKPGFLRSNADPKPASGRAGKKSGGRKKMSLFKRKPKPAKAADRKAKAAKATGLEKPASSANRRPLLMAAAVLLMIGSVSAYTLLGSRGQKLPEAKSNAGAPSENADPVSAGSGEKAPATNNDSAALQPDGDGPKSPQKMSQAGNPPMLPADTEITTNSISLPNSWPANGLVAPLATKARHAASPAGKDKMASTAASGGGKIVTASVPKSPIAKQQMLPAKIGSEPLRLAAAAGDPIAQFEIAERYVEGKLIDQDFRQASIWYQRAAAKGLAPAQYRLGTLYEKGRGVPRDVISARTWYERAAEKGNRKAMHNLAVIYASGAESKPDFDKAAAWFTRASALGLADSQYNLAILHERGLGVKADILAAYKWYALAARTGDKDAGRRAGELEEKIDQARLAEIKIEVGSWQPQPLDKASNLVVLPDKGWAVAPTKPGAETRSLLSEVQRMLNSNGYKAGTADGVMGKQTRRAIRLFQRNNDLTENGMVTPDLIKRLRSMSG